MRACNESHRLPVAEGYAVPAALADRRPTTEAGHPGVDAGLVEQDRTLGIDEGLGGHVRPVLLGGPQGFF